MKGLKEEQALDGISYLIEDEEGFSSTEYKLLKAQEKTLFHICIPVKYNGKIKLYYMMEQYKTMISQMKCIDEGQMQTMMQNLLEEVIQVSKNGFLHSSNMVLEYDKIYIDPDSHAVRLIYLPMMSEPETEEALAMRTCRVVLRMLSEYCSMDGENVSAEYRKIIENLENLIKKQIFSLEELKEQCCFIHVKGATQKSQESKKSSPLGKLTSMLQREIKKDVVSKSIVRQENNKQPIMVLTYMGEDKEAELQIHQEEYVIGKNAETADGVIDFNSAISRMHCKLIYKNKKYFVQDLNSSNGTYLNGKRAAANSLYVISEGDVLKLANCEFRISLRQEEMQSE